MGHKFVNYKNVNLKHMIDFFTSIKFPWYWLRDFMPIFNKYIYMFMVEILGILWSLVNMWRPKNFTFANFLILAKAQPFTIDKMFIRLQMVDTHP